MSTSTPSRVIYSRREGAVSSRSKTNAVGDKLSEQAAEVMGVRGICEVEENGFMRDKVAQVTSLGITGRRGISDSMNLGETQVGSVWKPRILMITMSSILLFSSRKKSSSSSGSTVTSPGSASTAPNTPGSPTNGGGFFKHRGSNDNDSDPSSSSSRSTGLDAVGGWLLGQADELKTIIPMEDVAYACQFIDNRVSSKDYIVQIRATSVTGIVRTHLVRVKSQERLDELMNNLEIALRAYRQALEALKDGLITGGSNFKSFRPVLITKSPAAHSPAKKGIPADEVVVARDITWDTPLVCRGVAETDILRIYMTGPKGVAYVINLRPLHVRAAQRLVEADDDSTPIIRGDAINNSKARPVSLTFDAKFCEPTSKSKSTVPTAKQTSLAEAVPAAEEERALWLQIKETTVVTIVCAFVAVAVVLPDWCFHREYVLTMLVIPVAVAMLFVRSKQQHQAIKQGSKEAAATTIHATMTPEAPLYDIELRLRSCVEGLSQGAMTEDQTEDELMDVIHDRETAQHEADAIGDASKKQLSPNIPDSDEKGIEELLQALSGAFDESLTEDNIPKKWFDATDNNRKDAMRQWQGSLQWRREENVDQILNRPLPDFFRIKKRFPHCWFGNDHDGHLVTLERFTDVKRNVEELKKANITAEDFAYHCVFLNEFWIKNRLTKTGRLNKIIDLKGFSIGQLSREVINYFQPMNHCMQQYPELIIKVYVINAPSSFRFIWGVVSPFLAKKTTEKINFPSGSDEKLKALLRSLMDPAILPTEYGGDFQGALEDVKLERTVAAAIRQLNIDKGVESPEDWAPNELPAKKDIPADAIDMTGSKTFEIAESRPAGAEPFTTPPDAASSDAHLDLLAGTWVGNLKESEVMDPILELQNINFAKRAVARRLTPTQNIEITHEGDRRHVSITTKTGPVTNLAKGYINTRDEGEAVTEPAEEDVKVGIQDESVIIRSVSAPPHMQDQVKEGHQVLRLNFKLANGDHRVVHHGIHRETDDKKVMSIEYKRAADNQSKTVTLVADRKQDS